MTKPAKEIVDDPATVLERGWTDDRIYQHPLFKHYFVVLNGRAFLTKWGHDKFRSEWMQVLEEKIISEGGEVPSVDDE